MDSKNILLSKTVIGLLVAVLAQVAARHGLTVDEAGLTNDVVTAAFTAFSIYGRFKATQPVHLINPEVKPQ